MLAVLPGHTPPDAAGSLWTLSKREIKKALPLMQVKEKLHNMVLPDSSEKGFRMVLRMELGNQLRGQPISTQLA